MDMMNKLDRTKLGNNARNQVSNAICKGKLPPPTELKCVDCGDDAECYDHRDYYQPLSVEPVCMRCNSNRPQAIPHVDGWNEKTERTNQTQSCIKRLEKRQMSRGLRKAVKAAESKASLARSLGLERATVSSWYRVPQRWTAKVEQATGVPRHELRPDLYEDDERGTKAVAESGRS